MNHLALLYGVLFLRRKISFGRVKGDGAPSLNGHTLLWLYFCFHTRKLETMTFNEFLEHGTHFCNFPADQIEVMFNREAIEELPSIDLYQNAAYMLSQLLIGNTSDPLNDLQSMEHADRVRVLTTWLDVLAEQSHTDHVARFMLNLV